LGLSIGVLTVVFKHELLLIIFSLLLKQPSVSEQYEELPNVSSYFFSCVCVCLCYLFSNV